MSTQVSHGRQAEGPKNVDLRVACQRSLERAPALGNRHSWRIWELMTGSESSGHVTGSRRKSQVSLWRRTNQDIGTTNIQILWSSIVFNYKARLLTPISQGTKAVCTLRSWVLSRQKSMAFISRSLAQILYCTALHCTAPHCTALHCGCSS